MMPGLADDHPSIRFYDGDYPGTETSQFASNLDPMIADQGLAHDIQRFRQITEEAAGRVLEIGCGTGRVLIPLARSGREITGVDISPAMIDRLRGALGDEPREVQGRVTLKVADVRDYREEGARYAAIIIPFNGLCCVASAQGQRDALSRAAALLAPDGRLVVDVVNPFALPLFGGGAPQPFFTRINPANGRTYTRFAAMAPVEADQTQRLHGWYDEIDEEGRVRRTPYEMRWRLIFPHELELMLEDAGLRAVSVEGDHRRSAFTRTSPKMFLTAVRI